MTKGKPKMGKLKITELVILAVAALAAAAKSVIKFIEHIGEIAKN